MKLLTIVVPVLLTACTNSTSYNTDYLQEHPKTYVRPDTKPNEALRDQEYCRQSGINNGGSPYGIDGFVLDGAIINCMKRLGYKIDYKKSK